jgi:uncharacterized OB-fold protein
MPSPRYWREVPSRLRLEAGKCGGCAKVCYPARPVCPECGGTKFDAITLSKKGTVVTSTVVHIAPSDFLFEAPYAVAIVETPEGARLMAQVVDCDLEKVGPGMEVGLEFRRIRAEAKSGILCYGYKAVPA